MTREIKFRVWNKGTAQMEIGTHICFGNGEVEASSSSVLMQFTGLKDKNGVEIYEGDILAIHDTESEYVDVGVGAPGVKVAETFVNQLGKVIQSELGAWGVYIEDKYNLSELHTKGFNSFETIDGSIGINEVEVIGNIYQNPELLNPTTMK